MTDVTGAFEDALRSSRYVRRILADEQSPAPASERAFPGLEADTGRNVLKRRRVVVPKDDFTKEAYRIVSLT